jgi:hypothetical protein
MATDQSASDSPVPTALPDPFASLSRFDGFRAAVEPLAVEFWTARQPLKAALLALERAWEHDPTGCAAPCLAVGDELRKANLTGFPAEMASAVKPDPVSPPERIAEQVAWCLLAAATAGDAERVGRLVSDLVARPAVGAEFGEALLVVERTCLAKWRGLTSPPFTDRLRAELERHDLEPAGAREWATSGSASLSHGAASALRDWLNSIQLGRPIAMTDPTDSWGPEDPGENRRLWMQSNPLAEATTRPPGVPSGNTPPVKVGKKSKGKNIDARMLKVLAENRRAFGWTAAQWAQHLDCAESTVKETKTWTEYLKAVRAQQAVEHARKMDRSKCVRSDRHNGGLGEDEFDD